MAESNSPSKHDDKLNNEKSNEQSSQNPQEDSNLSQDADKSRSNSEETLEELFQEKLQLDERVKRIQKAASELVRERVELNRKKTLQLKAYMESEKNEKITAEVIRERLSDAYTLCKDRESIFNDYLYCTRKKLENAKNLEAESKTALQQKLLLLESMISSFEEQVTTIESLMKPDYDVVCFENPESFEVVMTECNKAEDNCYKLTCLIIQED